MLSIGTLLWHELPTAASLAQSGVVLARQTNESEVRVLSGEEVREPQFLWFAGTTPEQHFS